MKVEGRIGIYLLKEIWSDYYNIKHSNQQGHKVEWKYRNAVFNTLGIGIEPTTQYLMSLSPSFEDFESWIQKNGRVSRSLIDNFNSMVLNENELNPMPTEKVFSESDLEKWGKEGYVVLKNAVSEKDCQDSVELICSKIGVDLMDVKSWYSDHPLRQGIMVQLFNDPVLDKNRFSSRVRLAFEQLWGNKNLIVSMDRVSFNPPETESYQFQGPNLHWDVSLKKPIPFGIQGLLYLNDTDEDQGAFTVIPGFHKNIENWLESINENPRKINLLDFFDEKPIAGKAGDLILWNHCLPHGSRPNHSVLPRIVQYINYQPLDLEYQAEWI
jgi:hypothetical protein